MSSGQKYRILVVDDERVNIDALSYILKPKYAISVAKDGKTAIEIAKTQNPDLILLDVIMPDMSGFEVITELKSSDITRYIPVIFITGLDNAENEEQGFILGAVDYITKPFHNAVVRARVENHLQIVENMRTVEQLSMMDALTGIPNRRCFDYQLKKEWDRAYRDKTRISILMIDLDRFKNYNDVCGHAQGDLLLRIVTDVFKKTLKRSADFVARWGGEEFVVLLPNTDLNGALEVGEQIRSNVEKTSVPYVNGTVTNITVSVGINSMMPYECGSVEEFFTGADKALYNAKNDGRNNVKVAGGCS